MYDFQQNKSTKASIAHRKLAYGIGINNADYITQPTANGKFPRCPYYEKWIDMIKRCYSDKFQEKNKSYIGCTTSISWHNFMEFRVWMDNQDWEGMELDKDIKIKGNKLYSPDTCLFVPKRLNSLLNTQSVQRGKYPTGVCSKKGTNKLRAYIQDKGKQTYLGLFSTVDLANSAYKKARKEKIQQLIDDNTYPMATAYLGQHI